MIGVSNLIIFLNNTLFQQGHIKLIKTYSKDTYIGAKALIFYKYCFRKCWNFYLLKNPEKKIMVITRINYIL